MTEDDLRAIEERTATETVSKVRAVFLDGRKPHSYGSDTQDLIAEVRRLRLEIESLAFAAENGMNSNVLAKLARMKLKS